MKNNDTNSVVYWYLKALNNFTDFRGRSQRKEYWIFEAVTLVLLLATALLNNYLSFFLALITIVPSLAVKVRRFHDVGINAWMLLLCIIPFFCFIPLFFTILDSQVGENKYGPNPKEMLSAEDILVDVIK